METYHVPVIRTRSGTAATSAKIGIALGSLSCFSIIAFGIWSVFELIARGWNIFQGNIFHIILPYGIFLWSGMFLLFCLICIGGWLYLKNRTPEHPGTLQAFIVITGVCALIFRPSSCMSPMYHDTQYSLSGNVSPIHSGISKKRQRMFSL